MRPVRLDDLFHLRFASDVDLAPDGTHAAYVRVRLRSEENDYHRSIQLLEVATGRVRPLTFGPHDAYPRFSPAGRKVAFLREVSDQDQLYILDLSGGEPHALTNLRHGVEDFVWAPDGRSLAVLARTGPDGPESGTPPDPKELPAPERHTRAVRRITRLHYRHDGIGYFEDLHQHLFIFDLDGTRRQLTHGEYDVDHPAFSPDGRLVAFTANLGPDPDFTAHLSGIWTVPSGGGDPQPATPQDSSFRLPQFTPDGDSLVCVGGRFEHGPYTQDALWQQSLSGGAPLRIGPEPDLPVGDESLTDQVGGPSSGPVVAPDGTRVYCLLSQSGSVRVASISLADGSVHYLTPPGQVVRRFSLDRRAERLAAIVTDPVTPLRAVVYDIGGRVLTASDDNHHFLADVAFVRPEKMQAHASDGTAIDTWAIMPQEKSERTAAVLEIHGGPMAMYADALMLEFQLLAAAGFAVVYTNPRGSQGYGQKHLAAIRGDWGNLDMQDVLAGLDEALSRHPQIDRQRLGVAGGSYGGYLTNWLIGHVDLFRAAVTMRTVSDEYSFFGTSDIGYLDEHELDALPWDEPERYLRFSPIHYAQSIHAPLLIIHSEEDYRCPIGQAEELYTWLRRLGRTVEMLRFPGEGHNLSRTGKPWHRHLRLREIVAWFQLHLAE